MDDYDYEERAAILQHDAGMSREEAEAKAQEMIEAEKAKKEGFYYEP
jgi:hypothetical protein